MDKTYFIDIDGTIFPHMTANELDNVYKTDHEAKPLPGVIGFWQTFRKNDVIVITTARPYKYRQYTERNLKLLNLRYDCLLMGIGNGTRILINDVASSREINAIAHNVPRDCGLKHLFTIQ